MDADLSHPVDAIPSMIQPIIEGRCDVTVGTRYMAGGGSENWSWTRKLISRAAGLLAKGLTSLSDPTSGFMAVRRSVLDGIKLNPLGWKIVLEVAVKAGPRIEEVPIVFADRKQGKSKLGLRAQVDYIHHLWHLYCYRYPTLEQLIKFCFVGFSGLFVDTAVLVALVHWVFLDPRAATVFAFTAAVSWNYAFNRRWSFRLPESPRLFTSYVLFCLVCVIGLGIRVGVMHLLMEYAGMGKRPWYVLASFMGVALVTLFNFLGSKYIAFANRT
jgi:dolichol-phosphate mannosyltransferase